MSETRPKVRLPGGGGLVRIALASVAVLIMLGFLWSSLFTYVAPNEFAVEQLYVGPSQGMQAEVVMPGLHLVIPGYSKLHVFPRTLQVLELNNDKLEASALATYAPSITIQTSEGYRVTVDVTVAYRIVDPYKLISAVSRSDAYVNELVRPRADQVLRQTLGALNAEEFYQGAKRQNAAYTARDLLDAELADKGLQIWSVMVRDYVYDERYQSAIENRKIQDQKVFKNRADAIKAAEEAEKNRVFSEGQATITVETQRGMSEVVKIKSEADLYARKRVAEGDLLVELAKAEAKRLENDALSAAGASNIVGLRMAEALANTQVIVIPTDGAQAINPLNLEDMVNGW